MTIPNEINKKQMDFNVRKRNKIDSDTKLSEFIWIFYSVQILNAAIKIIFNIDDKLWPFFSKSFMIIIMFFLFRVIRIILKRKLKHLLFAEIIVSLVFVISLIMDNAKTEILYNFFFWTTCVNIPLGIAYISIERKDVFLRQSMKYSNFILIIGITGLFFMGEQHTYSMSLAYFMLLPVIILINKLFEKFSIKQFLVVVLSILTILFYGARGPFLGIIYILAVNLSKSLKVMTNKSALLITLTSSFLIILILFREKIILSFYVLLNNLGIFSRTFYLLAHGSITGMTGRDNLFRYYSLLVQEKPLFGWGIAGGWISRGSGPHNAVLEIILSFGIISGGILSIFLLISFILPFVSRRILFSDIYTAYAAVNIPLIISSGDIWVKYNFFIYIFIIIEVLIFTNKRQLGWNDLKPLKKGDS